MKVIKLYLIFFVLWLVTDIYATIPDFTLDESGFSDTNEQQTDRSEQQGSVEFLWKRSLNIFNYNFLFEVEHDRLYTAVKSFREKLKSLNIDYCLSIINDINMQRLSLQDAMPSILSDGFQDSQELNTIIDNLFKEYCENEKAKNQNISEEIIHREFFKDHENIEILLDRLGNSQYSENKQDSLGCLQSLKKLKELNDLWTIFGKLESDLGKTTRITVNEIFEEYCENEKTKDPNTTESKIHEEFFKDLRVKRILADNLERLKRRNLCTASFVVIDRDGVAQLVKVTDNGRDDGKEVIFFSGSGNELIRILEQCSDFGGYAYCILSNNEDVKQDQLNLSRGFLEKKFKELLPKDTFENVTFYQQQLREIKNLIEGEKRRITTFSSGRDKTLLTSTLKCVAEMSKVPLQMMQECKNQLEQEYISKYFHSEQVLQLFLWEYATKIANMEGIPSMGRFILNIHSELDPCENCTHFLYLETTEERYTANPERAIPPTIPLGSSRRTRGQPKALSNIASGFFQRINHLHFITAREKAVQDEHRSVLPTSGGSGSSSCSSSTTVVETRFIQPVSQEVENSFPPEFILIPYVFVSSQKPESKKGLERRFLTRQINDMFSPIILDGSLKNPHLYFRHNGPFLSLP